jgi:hypothetical protein
MSIHWLLTLGIVLSACSGQRVATETPAQAQEDFDLYDTDNIQGDGGLEKFIFDHKDSGKTIDGKGKAFNNGKKTMVVFQSVLVDGEWKYPENIVFKNWKLNGGLRVLGVGPSSDTTLVKASSRRLGHTKRMRKAAPRNIHLQNLLIETDEKIPLVFGPGVHDSRVENSMFTGKSRSVAFYMDAESGENVVRNNIFNLEASREVIAVDGSASNQITDNIFQKMLKGAVHVYRNSGERGVVRHQEPRFNQIARNYFVVEGMKSGRAVFLGSRNGTNPNYRHDDAQFDFGSGTSNRDFAKENKVTDNRAAGTKKDFAENFIKDTESNYKETNDDNIVKNNERVSALEGLERIISNFEKTLEMPDLSKIISGGN